MIYDTALVPPRVRRRRVRLERILDEASNLVAQDGFGGLSIHRLASRLDYTPGALYRYFPSKDALVAALAVRIIESFAAVVERKLRKVPAGEPLAAIYVSLFAYRDLAQIVPNRFGLLSMLMADPRTLIPADQDATPVMESMVAALEPLTLAFEAAAKGADLDPGDGAERGLLAFAATHGLLQLRKHEQRTALPIDVNLLLPISLRALLIGWGASERRVDEALAMARRLSPAIPQPRELGS